MIGPWSVLSSEVVVSDRWLHLRADRCARADGRIIAPYYVAEKADWALVCPITARGDVLLVSEYRHGAGAVLTGLPGGLIDASDPDPEAAARRELREETGFSAGRLTSLGAFWEDAAHHTNRMHCFLAEDLGAAGAQALDANEQIEVFSRPLDDVVAEGVLTQAHHVACLLLALRALSARR